MHRSLAVFFCALSCASAFPVVFLTHEDGSSAASPRLFDCVSTHSKNSVNHESKHLSYRCRPNARSYEHLKVNHDFPTFEILEEPVSSEVTVVEEFSVPAARPLIDSFFPSSQVIANTKYEVVEEKPRRNRGGCDDDEVFVAELDLCMPWSPQSSAPKTATIEDDDEEEEETIVITPDFTIVKVGYKANDNKCKEGEHWNPSVGMCVPECAPYPTCEAYEEAQQQQKKAASQRGSQKTSTVTGDDDDDDDDDDKKTKVTKQETNTFAIKCKEGEILQSSTGVCVPKNNCWPAASCDDVTTAKTV